MSFVEISGNPELASSLASGLHADGRRTQVGSPQAAETAERFSEFFDAQEQRDRPSAAP